MYVYGDRDLTADDLSKLPQPVCAPLLLLVLHLSFNVGVR